MHCTDPMYHLSVYFQLDITLSTHVDPSRKDASGARCLTQISLPFSLFFLCLHTFFTLGWDFPNDGRVSCQEIIAAPRDKCFSVDCIETTWCSRWHRGLGMFLIWCSLPAGSGLQNCLSSPTHTHTH